MFKLIIDYPTLQEEHLLLKKTLDTNTIQQVMHVDDLFAAQKLVHDVYIDEKIIEYIVHIVFATRKPTAYKLADVQPYIKYGVSPRATLALHHAAKAHAFLKKRHFVTPDDVKSVHRLCCDTEFCSRTKQKQNP